MNRLIDDIPIIFKEIFPANYVNNVLGWGIPENELHTQCLDGTYKMLSLDIDFGLKCSLRCPHCFQNNQILYSLKNRLTWEETLKVIDEAKELGLKYVKILGAGEPFEDSDFLNFLVELDKRDIHTAVFTKGHVLGSDILAKKYFGKEGIQSAKDLIDLLYRLKTSILLGFNSFNKALQNKFVGINKGSELTNYNELRDNALLLLSEAGFNKFIPNTPTRLAIVAAPIKPENISEILGIFQWGTVRNIYVAACPTTSSGNGHAELRRESSLDFESYINELKQLYVDIYLWAIQKGVVKLEDFKAHGISLYPGAHPCNQVASGLYVRLDGSVFLCPGNDSSDFKVISNIRNSSIREQWINSQNYNRAIKNLFNFKCIARESTFFKNYPYFYKDIYYKIIKKFHDVENKSHSIF